MMRDPGFLKNVCGSQAEPLHLKSTRPRGTEGYFEDMGFRFRAAFQDDMKHYACWAPNKAFQIMSEPCG